MLRRDTLALLLSAPTSPLWAAAPAQVEQWVEPTSGLEYPIAAGTYVAGTRGLLFEQAVVEFQGERSLRLTGRDTDSGAEVWRFEDPFGVAARGLVTRESDGALFALGGRIEGDGQGQSMVRRRDGLTGALEQEIQLPYGGGFTNHLLELSADGGTLVVMVPAASAARILAYDPDDLTLSWEAIVGFGSLASISYLSVSSDGRVVAVAGSADDENDPTEMDMVWGCVDGATATAVWSKRDLTPSNSGASGDIAVATIRGEDGEVRYRVHTVEGFSGSDYYVQDGLRDRTIREGGIPGDPKFLVDDARGTVLHVGAGGDTLIVRSALTGEKLGARGTPPGAAVDWAHDRLNSTAFGYGTQDETFVPGTGVELGLLHDLATGQPLWSSEAPEPPEPFRRATVVGPPLGGTTRYVFSSTDTLDLPLGGLAYRVRESDGQLGARFDQILPVEAPAATVALSPSPTAGGWCALLVSQPQLGGDDLPTSVGASRLQRLRRFDPATGRVLAEIDLPQGGRDARAAFAYGGDGVLVADRIESAPYEEPVRVRALEVATGAVRWARELRDDAATPRGVVHLPRAGTCAVAWSDSPVQFLNRAGLSLLDAADGALLWHGFVAWAHPDGDELRMATLTGPLAPGDGERVLIAGEANSGASAGVLQVAAYAAQDGSLLWAREVDLPAAFPSFNVRIGALAADPDLPWLWVSGTVAAQSAGADTVPFLARVDAQDGSLAFASSPSEERIEAVSGLALEQAEPLGWIAAATGDVVLHATAVSIEGSDVRTAWVTAFSKADGAVRWSRILDPVQAPIFPLGLAANPADGSIAIYGARNLAPTSANLLEDSASAATWLDLATGDVLGDAVGSEPDGSRWISGVYDGAGLILSEVRRVPSPQAPRARLSRWSLGG